jgi:hypothetical protein
MELLPNMCHSYRVLGCAQSEGESDLLLLLLPFPPSPADRGPMLLLLSAQMRPAV